jgi:hypothetical protein
MWIESSLIGLSYNVRRVVDAIRLAYDAATKGRALAD